MISMCSVGNDLPGLKVAEFFCTLFRGRYAQGFFLVVIEITCVTCALALWYEMGLNLEIELGKKCKENISSKAKVRHNANNAHVKTFFDNPQDHNSGLQINTKNQRYPRVRRGTCEQRYSWSTGGNL